jgi:hypothetical protein
MFPPAPGNHKLFAIFLTAWNILLFSLLLSQSMSGLKISMHQTISLNNYILCHVAATNGNLINYSCWCKTHIYVAIIARAVFMGISSSSVISNFHHLSIPIFIKFTFLFGGYTQLKLLSRSPSANISSMLNENLFLVPGFFFLSFRIGGMPS